MILMTALQHHGDVVGGASGECAFEAQAPLKPIPENQQNLLTQNNSSQL